MPVIRQGSQGQLSPSVQVCLLLVCWTTSTISRTIRTHLPSFTVKQSMMKTMKWVVTGCIRLLLHHLAKASQAPNCLPAVCYRVPLMPHCSLLHNFNHWKPLARNANGHTINIINMFFKCLLVSQELIHVDMLILCLLKTGA